MGGWVGVKPSMYTLIVARSNSIWKQWLTQLYGGIACEKYTVTIERV